eukprot:TRINITY_DN8447_c0_g2_i2.p1 TRINITY_DN8447_c0_g2~~TRINITY_DN8447_c0_g2_i2.p1  ORF type:complete len:103 (+),score=17.07 TRINITY_DN8447_c0_g2_i2:220-528(+)
MLKYYKLKILRHYNLIEKSTVELLERHIPREKLCQGFEKFVKRVSWCYDLVFLVQAFKEMITFGELPLGLPKDLLQRIWFFLTSKVHHLIDAFTIIHVNGLF